MHDILVFRIDRIVSRTRVWSQLTLGYIASYIVTHDNHTSVGQSSDEVKDRAVDMVADGIINN